uniref:Melanocyte protein PMEL-like n=1 Tax=Sinocyclocheilus grahami TaxID=75366 RepID=A0A672R3M3_SINGR
MKTLLFIFIILESKTRIAHYRSWNSQMYPVWRDGDPRYRDCWKGGEVTFEVRSDSPTLTGAKATFNIDVGFPQNQTVLPDGQVVYTNFHNTIHLHYTYKTYLTTGSFRPQVVLMAAISTGCQLSPTPAATVVPPVPVTDETTAVENIVLTVSPQLVDVAPTAEEGVADDVTVVANDLAVSAIDTEAKLDNTGQEVPTVAGDTAVAEADNTAAVMLATPTAVEAEPATEVPVADMDPERDEIIINLAATVLPEPPEFSVWTVIETVAPTGDAVIIITSEAVVTDIVASVLPAIEDIEAVNETVAGVNEATETINGLTSISEATVSELEAELVAGTEATQAALVIAKRQAPEMPAETNCMIYRYGSFSTTLTVVQGIESVEIVEVNNVVILATELEQNAVDLTVTCQGSLPNQVCTVVSDADCTSPVQALQCNAVTPTSECQMVLRQFFNNSGTFCINVSLTNDVSLAVTSAKLSVAIDTNSSRNMAGATLGVLFFICAVGAIAFTYKRFKEYHPLRHYNASSSFSSGRSSVPLMLWNFLSRRSTAESRPLLLGRVV